MTLITNYINKDYIIIASEKRGNSIRSNRSIVSIDDTTKLLPAQNYVIGINGTLWTKKKDYLNELSEFIKKQPRVNPTELNAKLNEVLVGYENDNDFEDLRLTISGFYEDKLFSYYLDLNKNSILDCTKNDALNWRFNEFNDPILNSDKPNRFRQGVIFMKSYFREVRKENVNDLLTSEMPDLKDLSRQDIKNMLIYVYNKFHINDITYPDVGGEMDYCIISTDRIDSFIS